MTEPIRVLVTAYDYRPRLGGVATCAYELSRALSSLPDVDLRVIAPSMPGDVEFDRRAPFATLRRPLPATATRAIVPLTWWIGRETSSFAPHALVNLLWHPCGVAAMLSGWAGGRLSARRSRYFVMAHGVEVMESHRNLKKWLRSCFAPIKRMVFRNAAAALPVSRFTRDLLVKECSIPASRTRVVFNGVRVDEFTPGPPPADLVARYGLEGKKVLLTVTRLEPYKGVDRTLSALRYVVARHPDLIYLLCGEGRDRARLESLVRRFGLEANVIFAGAVQPGRLVDYYRLADCFVMVSREETQAPEVEGFGLVYLEAAACEKPSIAGRSGGIPDAVSDPQTGWLVDPESEYAISRALLECLEDPAGCRARGRSARERAADGYTWDHMARRVMEEVRAHVRH